MIASWPTFFEQTRPTLLALILFAIVLAAIEAGFLVGRRRPSSDTNAGAVQSIILTLVGLLLGFMFSFAAQRYDIRRDTGVREANAISTAYLRANFLQEPQATELRRLLSEHLTLRIRFYDAQSVHEQQALSEQADLLERHIWQVSTTSPIREPGGSHTILLSNAINDVLDRAAEENAVFAVGIPPAITMLLFIVVAISGWLMGYDLGRLRHRDPMYTLTFAVLVTFVTYTIADLSNPRNGLIRASNAPLMETHVPNTTAK
jgi:hypothetical protein